MYTDRRVVETVTENFVPVKIHIKEQPQTFERFGAQWTPTIIILDPDGVERHRIEGFLPADDFLAQLETGRGKIAFARSQFNEAERIFRSVRERYPAAGVAPEVSYWEGVSAYKASHDPKRLHEAAQRLKEAYPESEWARKASVWLG